MTHNWYVALKYKFQAFVVGCHNFGASDLDGFFQNVSRYPEKRNLYTQVRVITIRHKTTVFSCGFFKINMEDKALNYHFRSNITSYYAVGHFLGMDRFSRGKY